MASRKQSLTRRADRVRRQIKAVANGRPRLSVHRSSKNIYAQIIDDAQAARLHRHRRWTPVFAVNSRPVRMSPQRPRSAS
jgi:hypothetical protein